MGVVILTVALLIVVMTLFLFLRGGAHEPTTAPAGGVAHFATPERTVGARAERLMQALALEIVRRDPDQGDGPSFVARTIEPTNRQEVYVRAFNLPEDERVRGPDVIATVDFAHAEGFNKAILVSPNGFTDEALLAARDTIAELIDESELERILG